MEAAPGLHQEVQRYWSRHRHHYNRIPPDAGNFLLSDHLSGAVRKYKEGFQVLERDHRQGPRPDERHLTVRPVPHVGRGQLVHRLGPHHISH